MKNTVPLDAGFIAFVGALDIGHTETGLVPRRLPAWTRPQIRRHLNWTSWCTMPSGVRLRSRPTRRRSSST